MRRMYDSTTAADIPLDAAMVAGYIDGVPKWSEADWARFPTAALVSIALDPATDAGDVLDVERGAANPDQAPDWVRRRRAVGDTPAVYCSLALWPTVRAEFARQQVLEPLWWIAAYPGLTDAAGEPALYPGTIAHQYAGETTGSGGHYDLTALADYWPGVDPKPSNQGDAVGQYFRKASSGDTAVLLENSDFVGAPVPAGFVVANVDDITWEDMVNRFSRNAALLAAAFLPAPTDPGSVAVDLNIGGVHWVGSLTKPAPSTPAS